MILEIYWLVALFALAFTFASFVFKGNLMFPLAATLFYGLLGMSSGAINIPNCDGNVFYAETAMVYVWFLLSLVMGLITLVQFSQQAKDDVG